MLSSKAFLDFVGVAAPRCGTTWIAEALNEHPKVWLPPLKEMNFFDDISFGRQEFKYPRGMKYYRNQFEKAPKDVLLGEISPTYYIDPKAAARIYKHFPNVKILIFLRRPPDVVYSTYLKLLEYGTTEKTFQLALQKQTELKNLGFYYRFLKTYFDLFPSENIYVGIFEEFIRDPEKRISSLYRFLGVDEKFRSSVLNKRVNARKAVRFQSITKIRQIIRIVVNQKPFIPLKRLLTKTDFFDNISEKIIQLNLTEGALPKLDKETDILLMRSYEEDIAQLEKLINKNLDIWKGSR